MDGVEEAIARAAQLFSAASAVVCLTGAGVSAESGVPTFRDAQTGLWSRFDVEELATPQGFERDPGLVWRWYMWRLQQLGAAAPNHGHAALAELAGLCGDFLLVTQNVDDLHEQAGSADVLHLHGTLSNYRCAACAAPHHLTIEERRADSPPACGLCGDPVRPDVVWFGESLPWDAVEEAAAAAQNCDVMLVVGTSGLVYPASQLPFVARQAGAAVIDVNPEPGPITTIADIFLQGRSGELLPALARAVREQRSDE